MVLRSQSRSTTLAVAFLVFAALLACKKRDGGGTTGTAPTTTTPVKAGLCPSGKSEDPRFGEFKPAQTAFKERDYKTAKTLLTTMAKKYEHSASVRVWQGDAALFDRKVTSSKAADQALPFYEEGEKLHDKGCTLPIYERYYLRLGFSLAYLRKKDGASALKHLEKAEKEFDNSANVYYNMARAHCREKNLDKCEEYFEKTLKTAKALKRPKFVRSHYSLSHWVSRSRRQSEFATFRRDKRYRALIKKYND